MPILRKHEPQVAPERAAPKPRYAKPKILAVDLTDSVVAEIRSAGFNVLSGSFGTPIQGTKSERYLPVPINGALPNVGEQELIIADLALPEADEGLPVGEEPVGKGMWQRMDEGVLDPRPYLVHLARDQFERIYAYGGPFILFASPRRRPRYELASARMLGYEGNDPQLDNWGLIPSLSDLHVSPDYGNEITAVQGIDPDVAALLEAGSFTCTVEPAEWIGKRWIPLAANKYGKAVAGILVPEDEQMGFVFVLPRAPEKGKLITLLLDRVLPRLAPKLFPEDERKAWTKDDIYALPGVAEARKRISEVEAASKEAVERLRDEISQLETEHGYLHELLTATGDQLVDAVKKTLESLGFNDVRDVDTEEGQKDGRLREDLQIWRDPDPVVLTEVKGINGLPKDDDVFQVQKNVLPRSREWQRLDVRALTIINHQRGLPPRDRQSQPFQKTQIENAAGENLGLLTTWDLYRLARGYARNGWQPDDLAALLGETSGLIEPLPGHYSRIGEVSNYFEQPGVIAIQLDQGVGLDIGERIGFCSPVDFIEEVASSLEVDGKPVDPAPPGAHIGVKTTLTKEQARIGTVVYRVEAR